MKGREYLVALQNEGSSHAKALLRELGNDVSTAGFFLTLASSALDFKKPIQTMTYPADSALVKLFEGIQKMHGEDGEQGPDKPKSA